MSLAITVIAGGIIGMLINYFSDVLPVSRRFSRPICRVCNQPYSIKDYLISYKCPHCGSPINKRSIIVLISSIIVCILLNIFPFSTLGFWATLPILIFLGVILVIDIEHHSVLIETSIFGFVLCFIYGIILNGSRRTITGALAGFLVMLTFFLIGLAFSKIAGALRHKDIDEVVFGFGDVCLGLNLGLLTGWPLIIGSITISIIVFEIFTLIFFIALLLFRKYHAFSSALPFTPFLILGAVAIFYL
jgi:hypothetical protein